MDGQMCEDIRIGILVRTEFEDGKMWRRRATSDREAGIWIKFSSTVLVDAGGIRRFLAEWEQEP